MQSVVFCVNMFAEGTILMWLPRRRSSEHLRLVPSRRPPNSPLSAPHSANRRRIRLGYLQITTVLSQSQFLNPKNFLVNFVTDSQLQSDIGHSRVRYAVGMVYQTARRNFARLVAGSGGYWGTVRHYCCLVILGL